MLAARSPSDATDELPAPEPAGLGTRFVAALVDWILVAFAGFILFAALPQLFFAVGGAEAGTAALALVPAVLAAIVVAYFGVSWACGGRTVGMLVLAVRLVECRSGRAPRPGCALARTGLTLATFVSVVGLLVLGGIASPDEDTTLAAGHVAAFAGAAAFAAAALVGQLAALLDHEGRSLQDRLFGLAVERVPERTVVPCSSRAGAPAPSRRDV